MTGTFTITRDGGGYQLYCIWSHKEVEKDKVVKCWTVKNSKDAKHIVELKPDQIKGLFGRQLLRPGGGPVSFKINCTAEQEG